jgi:hypothetical protein
MTNTGIRAAFAAICFSIAVGGPLAQAQLLAQAPARQPQTRQAQPAPDQTSQQVRTVFDQDAEQVRRQFYDVLKSYPPGLGRVLRLDPTLMTNEAYLSSYPNVAAFLASHPDVPRNPGFYLERYDPNYSFPQPDNPKQEAIRMWRNVLEFMSVASIFTVVGIALISLIKYVVEYRRWLRISKVNAEVHNKILDRFGSNEELLAYIDSPAGRRFLEATPLAPGGTPHPRVSAPYGRILLSVQIGILLIGLALGFMWVSNRAIEEVREVFLGLSIVGLMLGLGFVVSAGASYVLSRRLGLIDTAARPPQTL